MMATFPRCRQSKYNCFANVMGKCFCLSDTRFPDGKECPFYKDRNEMPDFHEYFKNYLDIDLVREAKR